MRKIESRADIECMVDTFYSRVQNHDELGPIFNDQIGDRWGEHLEKMYKFWETMLLDMHTYSGQPFPKHIPLPIKVKHFDQWVAIFIKTIDDLFEGEKAEEVKLRAENIAKMFRFKLDKING